MRWHVGGSLGGLLFLLVACTVVYNTPGGSPPDPKHPVQQETASHPDDLSAPPLPWPPGPASAPRALAAIADQAAWEAVMSGRPVAYQRHGGRQRVEAWPLTDDASVACPHVRVRIRNGSRVQAYLREFC